MNRPYLIISGSIFGLVALLHLPRVVYGWTVQVGAWVVPEAASVVAMIIAVGLCA